MICQQRSHVHCRYGAWRAQRYVMFCLNTRASVTVMTTSWTKESNFYKIKPLLIGLLQRKVHHRVCQSLICSCEKSEPRLFPYSRVVVHFVACCGYNVDRWSFAPKDGVSRQKTRPDVLLPVFPLSSTDIKAGHDCFKTFLLSNTSYAEVNSYYSKTITCNTSPLLIALHSALGRFYSFGNFASETFQSVICMLLIIPKMPSKYLNSWIYKTPSSLAQTSPHKWHYPKLHLWHFLREVVVSHIDCEVHHHFHAGQYGVDPG